RVVLVERLGVDHLAVEVVGQLLVGVVYVGHTAGHSGREVASGMAQDDHPAAGHVLTTVITHALDHGVRAGVANREPLADHTAQEGLTAGGPEQNHVAPDDVVLGDIAFRGIVGRPHHDSPTGQTLADVVVGITVDTQCNPLGHEVPEAV